VFVDEAQDTNKNQIQLALRAVKKTGRIVAVGDRNQSLYGFRGADVDAIPNLIDSLDADTLPLSITYRNPKSVVDLVNSEFPHIPLEAADFAKPGTIMTITESEASRMYKEGDMVLCRCNAPLVGPAFELIRNGVKAIIRGRDIGKNLMNLIDKFSAEDVGELMKLMEKYREKEVKKLMAAEKNQQAQSLEDKIDTVIALADGCEMIYEIETKIKTIFSDHSEGVVFSSVHKAKGLEAERVYILEPNLMPHPMAKKSWEMTQEINIKYVAYTRSLDTLVFVEDA
jgi:superfamily I DNA/RNA helicase